MLRRCFLHELAAITLTTSASPIIALPQRKPKPSELAQLDATALAQLVKRKEITPLELVEDVLRRIEQVNPQLNAVLPKLFDVNQAKARAQQLAASPSTSALSGVPLLLKNIVQYVNADIDFGSRLNRAAIAKNGRPFKKNSPFMEAIEAAGLIVTGVTNAPEFGLIDTTESLAWGAAHNPWNLAYTTGGSSGGSAAAVAAGIVPLAHANDGGGSIRIPASQCGVFGLKPTRRRELAGFTEGLMAADTIGIASDLCVSRTVRDSAAFFNIVERKDSAAIGLIAGPAPKRLKIALVLDGLSSKAADPEVEKAIRATAKLCAALKHNVTETKLPINGNDLTDAFLGYWAAGTVGLAAEIEKQLGQGVPQADVLEPWTIGLMEMGRKRGIFQVIGAANKAFSAAAAQLETFFKSYDVILSPVLRHPPFKLGEHDPRLPFETLMERVMDTVAYTPLHNLCGTPAMSVPLGWTKDNLPIGSQFAAWRGGDGMLLALAYELEAARPWAKRKPKISVR